MAGCCKGKINLFYSIMGAAVNRRVLSTTRTAHGARDSDYVKAGGARVKRDDFKKPLLIPSRKKKKEELFLDVQLQRAQVVYIGAQKCFVTMYRDLAAGTNTPVLAYVSPLLLEQGVRSKIVVGDDVLVLRMLHAYKVAEVIPRRNLFQRADPTGQARPLASNLDQLLVCCSFGSPAFSSLVLDRVIVAARAAAVPIPLVIVLNKVDLAEPDLLQRVTKTYEEAGFTVCQASAQPSTGEPRGIENLRALLQGKTSALYGLSGAGKSSLLNRLFDLDIPTRPGMSKSKGGGGRHTTSASRLYRFTPTGAGWVSAPLRIPGTTKPRCTPAAQETSSSSPGSTSDDDDDEEEEEEEEEEEMDRRTKREGSEGEDEDEDEDDEEEKKDDKWLPQAAQAHTDMKHSHHRCTNDNHDGSNDSYDGTRQAAAAAAAAAAATLVIDTPGVRTFRPFVSVKDIVKGFPEIEEKQLLCRHGSRCWHIYEEVEHCGVLTAVARGELSETRYASYAHMILESLPSRVSN